MSRAWSRIAVLMVMAHALIPASAFAQRGPAGPRSIASTKQLHDVLISPSSDAVFGAAGDAPRDAQGWAMGTRVRDTGMWMTMSRALVDAAARAATAAEKKDAAALAAASDSITTACESCHQPYRDGGRQMRGNRK